MDNENKIQDNKSDNNSTGGIISGNQVAKETGEPQADSSMWRNWSAPKELKGTGLKSHEDPKLTSQQAKDLNVPVNDFRAQLENAVRGSKATKSLKVGEFDE